MIAIPVITVGGPVGRHTAEPPGTGPEPPTDPRDLARHFAGLGFSRLHLVDRAAASGQGESFGLMRGVLDEHAGLVQVAGGLSASDRIEALLSEGATWAVLGSRAVRDPDWLADVASAHPGAIIVALDVRERRALASRDGRRGDTTRDVLELVEDFDRAGLPLGGLLVTPLDGPPRSSWSDLAMLEDVVSKSSWPVLAGGGGGSLRDLESLEDRGVAGVLLGAILQSGTVDARVLASEFAE